MLFANIFFLQNDGPESHYIGNLWLEQNNDTQPGLYATQADAPHTGWQPLISSFIQAFKGGSSSLEMTPVSGDWAGALWYKTMLQSSQCPNEGISQYTVKPDGWEAGSDALNWAIVLPAGTIGYSVRFISNGVEIGVYDLVDGLNYGEVLGVQAGYQSMELLDASGSVVTGASGGRCVSAECPDCIYNMNPQVIALGDNPGDTGSCPGNCVDTSTDDGASSSSIGEVVYVDPIVWIEDNPEVECSPPCVLVLPPLDL